LYVVDTNVSGSESVLSDTNIMIKLNKEIACTMATDLNFYINKGITSDSANKVNDFDVICENGLSDTIVLDVNDLSCGTGNLCFNTSYTVTLEGGADGICVPYKNVNDLSDDGCIQDPLYNFTFKTETLKNLYILSTNAAGSSTFDYNSDITIKLSEEISCDMATNLNFYINKGVVSDSANKVDGFQVICNNGLSDTIVLDVNDLSCSTGGLCFNTSYTVTLEGGYEGICAPYKNVNDTTDNDCIKDPFSFFTFKTMELPEFVAVIEPMHNSTAIPLAVNPKITFSESINVTSVTTEIGADTDGVVNNICLVKGRNATDCSSPDVISITYVYTEGETVVTLVPNASLLADTDYTVVVSRDIKDVNSRNLSGFYSSSFKTSPGGLLSHIIVNNPDTITQLNIEMFFTEDVNVETLSNKTVYLTFVNEFDGTTYVPGTIEFPIGCNQVDNSNCTSAIFTPDFLLYLVVEKIL
jgi:hypothetical protein